jgi:LCP family protein required for cell wall assembly
VLVAAACGGNGGDEAATTTGAPASSITTTTTTVAVVTSSSTTTTPATTTSHVPADVVVSLDGEPPEGFSAALAALYGWIADPVAFAEPDLPEGLRDHIAEAAPAGDLLLRGEWSVASLPEGDEIGVAAFGADVVLLASDGAEWRVVGAKLPRFDLGPWYGEPVRRILVIGTDARPGYLQEEFRADSIHILASAVERRTGAIVGIPRDSYVATPDGSMDKFTHVNVDFGGEGMVRVAEEISGLEIDGYLLTGFLGFEQLVNAFDGITVDVPFGMAEPKSQAYLSAGVQILWGANALAFARNRTIPNGDFRRSLHQGLIIGGALDKVQSFGPLDLPPLLSMLREFTWTDLDGGELLTAAAGAFELDAATVPNLVLPGSITVRGGASVVELADGAYEILAGLDDGIVDGTLPEGTLTSE